MNFGANENIVFNAIHAEEIAPANYNSKIFSYRYQNGLRADRLEGFPFTRRQIEITLREGPTTAEQLSAQLKIDLRKLQKILDYLFTHSGEVAAFDMPRKSTFYFWTDAGALGGLRDSLSLGELTVDLKHLTPDDITAINSYLTNLLILKPSVLILDDAIKKTEESLELAKILLKLKPESDVKLRVLLLERKLEELIIRRQKETARWGEIESDAPKSDAGTHIQPLRDSSRDESPSEKPEYPFGTAHLLGRLYSYNGPDQEKRFNAESKKLSQYDFLKVRKIVIELDTFAHELENAESIIHYVDLYRESVFKNHKLDIIFRRISTIKYKPKIARRLHREIVSILERGWKVIDIGDVKKPPSQGR